VTICSSSRKKEGVQTLRSEKRKPFARDIKGVRRLAVLGVVAAALAAAAPAYAINDGRVPADECSGNPVAVGETPDGTNPGIAQADPVAPAVSANNPGQSTGARGQLKSNAVTGDHCV
jgi:hypothetical protein